MRIFFSRTTSLSTELSKRVIWSALSYSQLQTVDSQNYFFRVEKRRTANGSLLTFKSNRNLEWKWKIDLVG